VRLARGLAAEGIEDAVVVAPETQREPGQRAGLGLHLRQRRPQELLGLRGLARLADQPRQQSMRHHRHGRLHRWLRWKGE
jgi:hypothetical protein